MPITQDDFIALSLLNARLMQSVSDLERKLAEANSKIAATEQQTPRVGSE